MIRIKWIFCLITLLYFGKAVAQDLTADNMLLFQCSNGGWPKHLNGKVFSYDKEYSIGEKAAIPSQISDNDATIDNNATSKEIWYLAKAYKLYKNPKYLSAVEKGIRYLLKAQYNNGGWPQYYPDKELYRAEITYNDNAMLNAMKVLQAVALKQNDLEIVDTALIKPSAVAINKAIDCILKTQIKVNGKLTAWCQQYDAKTLQPAKARAFELASISGAESVGLVEFLMTIPNPSQEIKDAINAAVDWLKSVKIDGYAIIKVLAPGTPKGTDKKLVEKPGAVMWARYYEIVTNKPFFCDRDGIMKFSIQDIGYERRNGYAWYGNWPEKLLKKKYPDWARKFGK